MKTVSVDPEWKLNVYLSAVKKKNAGVICFFAGVDWERARKRKRSPPRRNSSYAKGRKEAAKDHKETAREEIANEDQ